MGRIGKEQHRGINIFRSRVSFVLRSLSTGSERRLNLLPPLQVCYLIAEIEVISMEELTCCTKPFCLWRAFSDGHSQSTYSTHLPVTATMQNCLLIDITCFTPLHRFHLSVRLVDLQDTSVWMAWSAGIQPLTNNLLTESLSVQNGSGVQRSARLRALPFNQMIFTIHPLIICLWLKKREKYLDKDTP